MGGAEGRSRSSPACGRSRCTSRTTRSTTRRFEGEIPKGEYGGGTVEIWDHGHVRARSRRSSDGGLTVRLHGERLEGTWTLVPAHLGRRPEELAPDPQARRPVGSAARNDYRPMLATLAETLPAGGDWVFEVKWDGYRALGYVRGGEARLVSRNGNDLTERFAARREGAREGGAHARTASSTARCARSTRRAGRASPRCSRAAGAPLVYEVFDLLELDGVPCVDAAAERAPRAARAAARPAAAAVQLSGVFDDGEALLEAARAQRLEGVMAKRAGSRYAEGKRTRDWLKVKTHGRQEFVICGWTKGQGRRAGPLRRARARRVPRRRARTGSATAAPASPTRRSRSCCAKLEPLRARRRRSRSCPKMPKVAKGDVVWVEPRLVCEVEFAEWTHDGHLRAPVVQGSARRQGGGRRAQGAIPRRWTREPREALQPRQGLLAGRGDHEGRPARVLPRGRAGARAASARPAVHDAPLSRRRVRQGVLPEGRAVAHAGLDPDLPRAGVDARVARRRSGGSRRRSSTTRTRCSGW